MKSFCRVTLFGHLDSPPEVRSLPGGRQVCSASVTVDESLSDGSTLATQFTVLDYSRNAQLLQGCEGCFVYVEGRLDTRALAEVATPIRGVPVVASHVEFLTEDLDPDQGDDVDEEQGDDEEDDDTDGDEGDEELRKIREEALGDADEKARDDDEGWPDDGSDPPEVFHDGDGDDEAGADEDDEDSAEDSEDREF
jgi:single-stranded DNA-binding protein